MQKTYRYKIEDSEGKTFEIELKHPLMEYVMLSKDMVDSGHELRKLFRKIYSKKVKS